MGVLIKNMTIREGILGACSAWTSHTSHLLAFHLLLDKSGTSQRQKHIMYKKCRKNQQTENIMDFML